MESEINNQDEKEYIRELIGFLILILIQSGIIYGVFQIPLLIVHLIL
jgi:hypothetical protein